MAPQDPPRSATAVEKDLSDYRLTYQTCLNTNTLAPMSAWEDFADSHLHKSDKKKLSNNTCKNIDLK